MAGYAKTREILQRGTRAAQPAAGTVQEGTLYYVTDEQVTERSDGTASWETFSGAGGPETAGPMGPPGQDGADGDDGLMGPPGPPGAAGAAGPAGVGGPPGMDGIDGDDGLMGPPGVPGAAGAAGAAGVAGAAGPPGADGADADDAAIWAPFAGVQTTRQVGMAFDGSGAPPTVSSVGYLVCQFTGTITGWSMVADVAGSAVVDVWKLAGAIPTNANSIAGAQKPTLTAQQLATSTAVNTWQTTVVAGDVFGFEVESASTVTRMTCTVSIRVQS